MDRVGEGVPVGYLPAMHLLVRGRCCHGLLNNTIAVVWVHCDVAITVKNNGRDGWRAIYPIIGAAPLPHRDDCRGKVSGDPAGKTRMHTDCCVQIAICCSHDSSSGCSGRKSTNVDALWINRIVAHDLPGDAGDK